MNTVRMILCGNVEDSRMNPSEKVGVVSVVFVSTEEEKIKNKLKKLQDATIRTFVMKFHEMGLLTARKAGNRVFYRVGGTSDGRPNESKRGTL